MSRWRIFLFIGISVAALGLIGNGIVVKIQGQANLELEREKFRSNVILEFVKTGNVADSARNLKFLIEAGFIQDRDGRIKAYLDDPQNVPVLPPPSSQDMFAAREGLDSAIDRLDPAKVKALLTMIEAEFPGIKPFIEGQYPESIRAADQTGEHARAVLRRAVVLTARSQQDVDRWNAAIDSL